MAEREPISKKLRFEIFKRDNFTCQYCGCKSPDVILQIDHINPVAKGGGSDILNLITACSACNGGKSDRLLSDQAELEKQRAQLEELNERRQQLEWMLEWRGELVAFHEDVNTKVADYWLSRAPGHSVTETGAHLIAKWLRSFGFEPLLDAIDKATTQYLRPAEDGSGTTADSANHAFNMVPRIANVTRRDADKPWLKDCYYIRGILRNRLSYVNEPMAVALVERAILSQVDTDWVKDLAKRVSSWTHFKDELEQVINEIENGE